MKIRPTTTMLALSALALWSSAVSAENLEDIYRLALNNDPAIRAAEATYKAGLETEKISRSRLLPQINATGTTNYNESSAKNGDIFGTGISTDFDTDTTTNAWGASLDQAIVDMPAWFSFKQGKELTRQSTAQFAADQQDLIIRVAEAYFNVLRALDFLNASRALERANQRQLDQTQQRFDVGLIAITDVHESQAAYDIARAERLRDEGDLGVALEQLSVLTAQRHDNLWLLQEDYPITEPNPMDKEEWVEFAMKNNNQIKASAYGRDAANENAKSSKSEHYPKLRARLGYDDNDNDNTRRDNNGGVSNSFDSSSTQAIAALNLTVPLYSGGFISASRRQAYQQYNRSQEEYAGVVRQTAQATRALHLQTVVNVATTKAQAQAVISSKSALDATQAGYEVGTRNIVDVLNVQQNLFSAVRDYSNARYDYVLSSLRLKNTAGLITPQDIIDLNEWLTPPEAPTLSNTGLTP